MRDEIFSDRYLAIDNERKLHQGWPAGWALHESQGSPAINKNVPPEVNLHPSDFPVTRPIDLDGKWPDTEHYHNNTADIMDKARDLDSRQFKSWLEKAFWLNVLRVPLCASYLAGCAKVMPQTILELGTGGDSAHSTGMFLYWLENFPVKPNESRGTLVSVDRHPLSTVWPRYRNEQNWWFIQGDSVTIMQELPNLPVPNHYDLVFIDSSHQYSHTLAELRQAAQLTNAILCDDSSFTGDAYTEPGDEGGVVRAIDEFMAESGEWLRVDLHGSVALLERHPKA